MVRGDSDRQPCKDVKGCGLYPKSEVSSKSLTEESGMTRFVCLLSVKGKEDVPLEGNCDDPQKMLVA